MLVKLLIAVIYIVVNIMVLKFLWPYAKVILGQVKGEWPKVILRVVIVFVILFAIQKIIF